MKRRFILHFVYWILILMFLTLFFGNKWESKELAFLFSCLLLPVVMGTSYFFNLYLVPKFLLTRKYKQFVLYLVYMFIVSLYLELLIALLSFVVLADSKVESVNLEGISIFILGITMYLIVFASSFIQLLIQFQQKVKQLNALKSIQEKGQQASISIRANRKTQILQLKNILYIESLNDVVKIVTPSEEITTREKISRLSKSLPDEFIRIHRSFIINTEHLQAFNHSEVQIQDTKLPISRTYKKGTLESLKKITADE